nr:hypothetical protein [Tanacetum cinerariifolium]
MGYDKITQKLTFYKAFFFPQWKFLIHTILQRLNAKTTAWNEFRSTMASTIIFLSNNKKFNFSKYIFDNIVKNLEVGVKFFMFPRFVQVFWNHQLGDMSHHKKIFVTPSLTKKVFANMKREGKGVSGIITPLFETMMVQAPEEVESFEDKESLGDQEDASKQGRMIDSIDQDVNIILVDETQGMMNEENMIGVNDLDGDEVLMDAATGEEVEQSTKVAEKEVSTADPITIADLNRDQAAKHKARRVIVQEPSEIRTTLSSQPSQLPQAKDKEVARKLEAQMKAKMEEEERIAREKDEANTVVIEQYDEVQAKIDADMELAQKL